MKGIVRKNWGGAGHFPTYPQTTGKVMILFVIHENSPCESQALNLFSLRMEAPAPQENFAANIKMIALCAISARAGCEAATSSPRAAHRLREAHFVY